MCKKVWRAIKLDYSSFFYSIAGCSATIIAIIGGFIASKLISISADRDNILDKIKEINDELNMKTKQHDDIIEKLDDDDALDFVRDNVSMLVDHSCLCVPIISLGLFVICVLVTFIYLALLLSWKDVDKEVNNHESSGSESEL